MNDRSTNAPCLFVLEPDDNTRPLLRHNLKTWGYQLVIALDAEDAIQRTGRGQGRFDLILISQVGQTLNECMAIGQQIRQNMVSESRAPILIIAERYGADLEGQNIQVGSNEYVTYLEDGQQLKNMLQRLCPVH